MTSAKRMTPPLLGQESKLRRPIVLHELRAMSLFPGWTKDFIFYNRPRVEHLIATRTLDEIQEWTSGDWGLWNSVLVRWRQFLKNRAGF